MPTEADTCRKFVVPKLQAAGWDDDPHSIAEQRSITDGRIVPVGKGFMRKRVDARDQSRAGGETVKNMKKKVATSKSVKRVVRGEYDDMLSGVVDLLEAARRTAARSVNTLMTATYWEIGRRIVEFEMQGASRAEYGEQLLGRLARDLTSRFGRGFSRPNLTRARQFYLAYPAEEICSTLSNKFDAHTESQNRATASLKSSADPDAQTLSTVSREFVDAPASRKRSTLSGKLALPISQTPSVISKSTIQESPAGGIVQTPSAKFTLADLARAFPLPWSQYVLLMRLSSRGCMP